MLIVKFNSTLCTTTFTLAGCVVKRGHLEYKYIYIYILILQYDMDML